MISKRDWLLQQLGITQWQLRRAHVLQGEVAVNLPNNVRLLIVTQQPLAYSDTLLGDILCSIGVTPEQIYVLTQEQAVMLPQQTQCNCWRIGIEAPLSIAGVQIYSPLLAELAHDIQAKRMLWQQICHYEHYFFPHNS